MNCLYCNHQFDALLDGALDPSSSAAVRAHLDGCAACARQFHTLEKSWELLAAAKPIAPSTGFVERTLRRATAADAPVPHLPWWLFWSRPRLQLAATSAFAALALLVGGVWFNQQPVAPNGNGNDVTLVEEEELLENLPLLAELDLLEDFEDLELIEMTEVLD